jgi:hypothetical protein
MNHEEALRAVDRHFTGRLAPAKETAMRAHLPGCAACRDRYQRHLSLARIDRRVPSARERLARGLGLDAGTARATRSGTRAGLALVAAAAVALVLVARPRTRSDDAGFLARGAATRAGGLWIYRVTDGAAPSLVSGALAAGDELAFAYANPASKRYLAIFGVDEHRHVFWYYPSWVVGAPPPSAVPASAGPGPHELPEAVRHPLDGRRLDVYALFTDEHLGVAAIEQALARRAPQEGLGTDTVLVRRSLEVRP